MLNHYHLGAYGQVHHLKWSCCNAANRNTQGCQQTINQPSGNKPPRRMTSLRTESHSGSEGTRRPFVSLRGNPKTQQQNRSPSPVYHDAREAPEDPSVTSQSLATCTSPFSELEQEESTDKILEKLMHQDSQTDSME